jgi:hypothetical protein
MADEVARLSRLKAQLEHPISGHAYDLDRPPLGWSPGEIGSPAGVNRAAAEWQQARQSPPPAVPEEQRKLCWLAMVLANAQRASGQPVKARAVLETVLEMLQDEGHRHLIRCRLAREALDEGDLLSAQGWLGECDPYPEVLELDSAYRAARGRLFALRSDAPNLLAVVGLQEGDVPFAPDFKRQITLLRIHGLEIGGYHAQADTELAAAIQLYGEEDVLPALNRRGFAPGARQRARQMSLQSRLEALETERGGLARGLLSAAAPTLGSLPILVLVLMIPVSVVRCSCDADPLFGVYGYPLCPKVCDGCRGPVRVVTEWHSSGGGEYSSDGAQYFCISDANRLEYLTDEDIERSSSSLSPYELNWASALGATYLILFVLILPYVPIGAVRRRIAHSAKLKEVEMEMEQVARELNVQPPPRPRQRLSGLGNALLFCLISTGIAGIVLVGGMLF